MKKLVTLAIAVLSLAVVSPALAWTWPVDGEVVRSYAFGSDPYAAGLHRGIDIASPSGAEVRAPAAGVVTFRGFVPSGGTTLTIVTSDGYAVTLQQLDAVAVAKGDVVSEGAIVASVGTSSDAVTVRTHVHVGVRLAGDRQSYLDPLSLLLPVSSSTTTAAPAGAAGAEVPSETQTAADTQPAADAAFESQPVAELEPAPADQPEPVRPSADPEPVAEPRPTLEPPPGQPVGQVERVEPVEQVEPAEPAEETEPAGPAERVEPAEAVKPVEPELAPPPAEQPVERAHEPVISAALVPRGVAPAPDASPAEGTSTVGHAAPAQPAAGGTQPARNRDGRARPDVATGSATGSGAPPAASQRYQGASAPRAVASAASRAGLAARGPTGRAPTSRTPLGGRSQGAARSDRGLVRQPLLRSAQSTPLSEEGLSGSHVGSLLLIGLGTLGLAAALWQLRRRARSRAPAEQPTQAPAVSVWRALPPRAPRCTERGAPHRRPAHGLSTAAAERRRARRSRAQSRLSRQSRAS